MLGRIALPPDRTGEVSVSYHLGFSAEIGGGEYGRAAAFASADAAHPLLRVPDRDHPTIQSALDDLPATGGIVEIVDNGRYEEALAIAAGPGAAIELRAADECFPHLRLPADLEVRRRRRRQHHPRRPADLARRHRRPGERRQCRCGD